MSAGRSQRLHTLSELLRSGGIASQEEATGRLRKMGFAVTQATVSRDLEQLGAVKVKRGGTLRYALPDQLGAADWSTSRLERIVSEWVVSVETSGPMLVLRTPPASARLVASAVDQAQMPEIAGTVAGDDTLFVALRDGVDAAVMQTRFRRMTGERKAGFA